MDLTTALKLILDFTPSVEQGSQTVKAQTRFVGDDTLADGTAAAQADELFFDTRQLNATSENLDLAGSLTNIFGETITFVNVKCIYVRLRDTVSGHYLLVGGAASNAFPLFEDTSDKIRVQADGRFLWWSPVDGRAVTAGTGDILKIETSHLSNYDIAIVGTTA